MCFGNQMHAVQGNSRLQALLKVHSMGEPPFPVSRHSFPDNSSVAAPVALPVEKDRVRLQVTATWQLHQLILLNIFHIVFIVRRPVLVGGVEGLILIRDLLFTVCCHQAFQVGCGQNQSG